MLDCNTYVIKDDTTIIIDPGFNQFMPALIQSMQKDGIQPEDIAIITNTHLHGDHYWANEDFKKISGAKILSHPLHQKFRDVNIIEGAKFFGLPAIDFKEDDYLDDSKLNSGHMEFDLIHSPGHSPDSICFYCEKDKIMICGDVIFDQNTGRVDLPGGNADELRQSIESLSELPVEYLLPGHMNILTGADKVRLNFQFVKEQVFQWL